MSLQGKDKIAQTVFSFQNKVKLFINTKSLQHFTVLKRLVNSENDLCSEEIKVYAESLEGVSTNFATRFSDLANLKPTFTFLVNPLVVDVVKDGCPVVKPIVT